MPVRIPVEATRLEQSIIDQVRSAGRKIGKKGGINLGTSAKSIESLSQPLGRITGKADQFTKSMEAANARVLAFGASVGVLSAVTKGFKDLVTTTIEVEKSLASINAIMGAASNELERFKKTIFDVARNTEQSFATVAEAALEFSRQGLSAQKVVERLNDSMILARLSGLGASEAVAGLTAAINSFNSIGIKSSEVLNKLSAAAASAAVSERDLIEGIKRSGAVAIQAGVEFDELVGVISAVQEKTARGGAVIGNSFKTIFTRLQSLEKLKTMRDLGVEVTDASGAVLSATKLITNLGQTIKNLPSAERLQIAENLVGKFQVAPFLAILEDMSRETSRFAEITQVAGTATDEAYTRNIALNKTLAAAINEAGVNLKELANTLGEIGVTESLKNILGFFNSLVTGIKNVLEGEGIGSDFARGIVKGIGNIISGPGLAIFAAIIAKLTLDLIKFGGASLKTFFGIGSAAKQIAQTQGQIAATLLNNKAVQDQILKIENSTLTVEQKRVAQTQYFTAALNTQLATMQKMQAIAARVAPGVVRGTTGGRKAAGGFIPNFDAVRGYGSEQVDINRGVGGAPPSARPVTIPNFAFGNGKRGTITANTSEFIVPNFAGGGSAIFNQDMVKSMGLPSGARKIGAAGGYIPNFAKSKGRKVAMPKVVTAANYFYLVPDTTVRGQKLGPRTIDGQKVDGGKAFGLRREALETASDGDENLLAKNVTNSLIRHTKRWVNKLHPLGRKVSTQEVRSGFEHTRGAKGAMAGAIGSAFEVGITKALDYKAAAREKGGDFDVRGGTNLAKVQELFGFPPGQTTGDFKVAVSPDSIISFYKKVIKERRLGTGPMSGTEKEANIKTVARQEIRRENKGMFQEGSNVPKMKFRSRVDAMLRKREKEIAPQWNYAGGYIPNFANASPLAEAIQRESQAGLPINQIRINQTSRLRNAGNPMGLAVTNMRDEPTGKVPNFAKKPMGGEMGAVSGDLMMKFMGLTMAAQMLQGMFSQMGEETSNFSKGMGEATNAVMMMAMMAMMGGGKMGFAPLAAGPWSQKGGSMIGSGMAVFGGGGGATRKNPMTGMVDSRTRAAGAGRLAKVGGGLRVAGGVGLKGISLFGRLLPVIGQLLFAFQALSGVVKMFGGDLGGSIKEFLTPLGVALNLVDTPAEKTAKALDKLGDQAYKTALASGFQETAFDDFFKNIRRAAAEENVRAQLGDKVEKDEDALAKKLKLDTQREAVKAVEDDVMEGLGVKMVVGTFNTPGQAGRDEFTATFAGDLSREEIRKKIDDTIAARRTALPQSTIMTNPKNFTTFRESTRRREEEERFQEEIAEKRREAQTIMRTGSIDEVEEFIREGDVTGILSATQKVALGQLRSTALGAFGSREENQALADIANMGGDTTKQQERMIAAFDPEEAKLYKEIQDEIRTGKLTELEVEEKINAFLARRAKKTKAETQQAKIQESLAKARLKNMVELTTLQVKMTTQADLEAKTKLSLLSTSAKEKVELQAQVEARKRQRDLIADQIKATSELVQSQGQFAAQLKSKNPTEDINAEQFEKIKDLVEATNQKIIEQGGYNEKVGEQLFDELQKRGLSATLAQNVVDLVAEQNGHLQKQADITADIYNNEQLRAAVANAELKTQQRKLSNLQAELSLQDELHTMTMETEAINLRITQLEGQKIGKNKKDSLAIDKLITAEKEKQIRLDARRQTARINEGLRKDIFAAAKDAGLPLGELTDIQGQLREVQGMDPVAQFGFASIISRIEEASKEADKARIDAAAQLKLDALEQADIQLDGAIDSAEQLRQAGTDFRTTVASIFPKGMFSDKQLAIFQAAAVENSKRTSEDAKDKIKARREAVEAERRRGHSFVDAREGNIALERRLRAGANEFDQIMRSMENSLAGLSNEMARAKRIFATFEELVDDLFDGLEEQLARVRLDRFMQTTSAGMIDNLTQEKFIIDKMRIDEDKSLTPSQRAAAVGRLEEGKVREALVRQARISPTAAGANQAARELKILNEMVLVKQDLEAGNIDEVEAMEKLVKLEERRLTINDSLSAMFQDQFVKKQSEISKQFNEKFVGAAKAFTTELTHGMVDAIAKGESLKDVLLSAATGFLNTMSKAFMDKAVDNLMSGLFSGSSDSAGILTSARGGPVRGGSGAKDDVPALLMGGEFVMRKKAVNKYGAAFMEALNAGSIPQMGNGGFFIPGTRGQGAISGKRDLLSFATQSYTGGKTDRISSGANFASVFLEPESVRMTQFGRRNNPMFQRTQDSKREAFDLYVQQLADDKQRAERALELAAQKKAQKDALWRSLAMAAVSGAFAYGTGKWAQSRQPYGSQNMVLAGSWGDRSAANRGGGFSARGIGGYAAGGAVPYAAGVDTIPSMLSGGEFVMNAAATQRLGAGNLETLNAGGALGSDNGEVLKKLDNIAEASGGETQINITVNSNGSSEEDSQGNNKGQDRGRDLGMKIRDAVRDVIVQEKRLGGLLRG